MQRRGDSNRRDLGFYRSKINWRFIEDLARAPICWKKEHWALGSIGSILFLLCFFVLPGWANVVKDGTLFFDRTITTVDVPNTAPLASNIIQNPELSVPKWIDGVYTSIEKANEWTRVEVKAGQTLSDIFATLSLSSSTLQQLLDQKSANSAVRKIRPGMQFAFLIPESGKLNAVQFDIDDDTRKIFWLENAKIREQQISRVIEKRTRFAAGEIQGSLFGAADAAGVSDGVIMQMAKMFSYDVDFAQDIRSGDRFAVVFEEEYRDGQRLRDGTLLAAEFINRGEKHAAVRYTKMNGDYEYFTPEGRSLRKAFVRTPLEFTRISSKFSSSRRHPVLGTYRAHKGVDYAAPSGTPVWAAGDGKLQFRGWKNGYGNCVIVEHHSGITTLYGHLSRFYRDAKVGKRVRQGELIGYVGATGLATAPHLHYEFRVNGLHRDPLAVTLPRQLPLAGRELVHFKTQTDPLMMQLALIDPRDKSKVASK